MLFTKWQSFLLILYEDQTKNGMLISQNVHTLNIFDDLLHLVPIQQDKTHLFINYNSLIRLKYSLYLSFSYHHVKFD